MTKSSWPYSSAAVGKGMERRLEEGFNRYDAVMKKLYVRKEMERRLEEELIERANGPDRKEVVLGYMPSIKKALKEHITDEDIEESFNRGLSEEEWTRRFEINMENLLGTAMIMAALHANEDAKIKKKLKLREDRHVLQLPDRGKG